MADSHYVAVGQRAHAFKSIPPGVLPPLGIIFGLLAAYLGYVRDTCKKVSQGCESHLGSDTFDDHTHPERLTHLAKAV